ncbi:MAG: hypothetical protein IT348_17295 [Candidatus Eisenbacteria bacterium]|nr:hypothetical protein [Candidatus Eisenbacteria bacterium]
MRFFAYFDPDPRGMRAMEEDLRRSRRFDWVGSSASAWLVGCSGRARSRLGEFVFLENEPDVAHAELEARLREPGWQAFLCSGKGDYGFAHFDSVGGVHLVRAAAGVVPIYLWESRGRLACSSRLGEIARFVPDEPELEPLVNATCCSMHGWLGDRRTFLTNTQMLAMGEAAHSAGARWSCSRWWDPSTARPSRPTAEAAEAHEKQLRTILLRNLETAFEPGGRTLLTFSGGVDSSALLALAAGTLGKRFSTLSFVPSMEPFQSNARGLISSLVGSYQSSVANSWEFEHSVRGRLAQVERAPREVFQVPNPALCVLPQVVRAGEISALCGGEYCDDLLGSELTKEDWDLSTSPTDLLRHREELANGPRSALGWLFRRALIRIGRAPLHRPESLPMFVRSELRAEYRDLLSDQRRALALDPRPRVFVAKRLESAQTAVAQNWEVTSALGVRRVYPFLSRELVELAFDCHPSEGIGPGTKKLLRQSLRGLVPDSHLLREAKENWTEPASTTGWRRMIPQELSRIVAPALGSRPPDRIDSRDALRLTLLLNISQALRTVRAERRAV